MSRELARASRIFLSAEWRDLVMLNYELNPELLADFVPNGTELDFFKGKTFISLVGFRFLNTKLYGVIGVPLHTDFDEINLRFYVRRKQDDGYRRGVVFIREIVSRPWIATIARRFYGENYVCYPTNHRISEDHVRQTEYEWVFESKAYRLFAQTEGIPHHPAHGSLEQFIAEHYWGYSTMRRAQCLEYRVSHDPWRVWVSTRACFEGDAIRLYGHELGSVLSSRPESAFVAEGSPVLVHKARLAS